LTVPILSPKFISFSVPSSGYSMIQNFEYYQPIFVTELACTSSLSYRVGSFISLSITCAKLIPLFAINISMEKKSFLTLLQMVNKLCLFCETRG